MSTGGTESILLVCMAYRNMIQEQRGIRFPEMFVFVFYSISIADLGSVQIGYFKLFWKITTQTHGCNKY